MKKYFKDADLLVLLGLGAIIYFQMAWTQGFFHDGYLYAAFGKNAAESGRWLVPHLTNETYPQFFHHTNFIFILEGLFFKVFGSSFVAARIFAGLFSLLTGFFLFRFINHQESHLNLKRVGYLALLFFFLIPPLMKKSRFPNLDLPLMLFMFLSLSYYWKAFQQSSWKNWLLAGFFFGLCALTKGPMAVWCPFIIFVHVALCRNWKIFADIKSWVSLVFGLLIFSIWPLSLYLNNQFDIFHQWYQFTFISSILEGRGASTPWYTYIAFLFKKTNIFFVLALVGIWHSFKEFKEKAFNVNFLFSITFLIMILTLSTRGLKYSNYLIPAYPFMAYLAAFGLKKLWTSAEEKLLPFFRYLIPLFGLVLLIFPLTNVSKRDQELFKSRELFNQISFTPKRWVNFNGAYPYWSVANLNGYIDGTSTINIISDTSIDLNPTDVALVKDADVDFFLSKFSEFKKFIYFKKRRVHLLIPKSTKTDFISL